MEFVEKIIYITELIGVCAFALSGAFVAIKNEMDIFGVCVLGCVTALGGGVLRDTMIGNVPPMMFRNYIYIVLAISTCVIVFAADYFLGNKVNVDNEAFAKTFNFCDALGLGIFTVIGMNTAMNTVEHTNWLLVIFVGVVTGIGGGILRDIMADRMPEVLYKKVYAQASLAGAVVYYLLYLSGAGYAIDIFAAIIVTVTIRVLSAKYGWSLPKSGRRKQ